MRFSANISTLWRESPFMERLQRARAAGFEAVEFWWPRGEDLQQLAARVRELGLRVVLFNFDAGDMPAGDRGLLSDPARHQGFREHVPVALELARALGCRRLNALVGLRIESLPLEEQLELARQNVAWAADQAAPHGIEVLIEPVNTHENGPYLLPTVEEAVAFIRAVGRDNVRLQYDLYHAQVMLGERPREAELLELFDAHRELISHVQIADWPGRGQPGSGSLDFQQILSALEERGYAGYVGLEYIPRGVGTDESLRWLPREARAGDARPSQILLAEGR